MHVSGEVAEIINTVFTLAKSEHFPFVTPELALYVICKNKAFAAAFGNCNGKVKKLENDLRSYLDEYMEPEAEDLEDIPELSQGMGDVLAYAWQAAQNSGKPVVELPHIIHAMYGLEESYAVYYMRAQGVEQAQLLQEMTIIYEEISCESDADKRSIGGKNKNRRRSAVSEADDRWENAAEDEEEDADVLGSFWRQYASCLNDELEGVNPLIGREQELERTM